MFLRDYNSRVSGASEAISPLILWLHIATSEKLESYMMELARLDLMTEFLSVIIEAYRDKVAISEAEAATGLGSDVHDSSSKVLDFGALLELLKKIKQLREKIKIWDNSSPTFTLEDPSDAIVGRYPIYTLENYSGRALLEEIFRMMDEILCLGRELMRPGFDAKLSSEFLVVRVSDRLFGNYVVFRSLPGVLDHLRNFPVSKLVEQDYLAEFNRRLEDEFTTVFLKTFSAIADSYISDVDWEELRDSVSAQPIIDLMVDQCTTIKEVGAKAVVSPRISED
jgi:hypothetical protein